MGRQGGGGGGGAPTPERRPSVKSVKRSCRSHGADAAALAERVGRGTNKAILSQLKRAGITDAAPSAAGPAAAGSGRLPQAQLAKAAL